MGYKSRTNWQINLCLKKDCKNRNKKCEICIKFSEFVTLASELYEKYKKENK